MRVGLRLGIFVAIWVLGVAALAQLPTTSAPTPTPQPVPDELATPRKTFSTLIDAIRRDDGKLARSTLDLMPVPLPLRETEGTRRARLLGFVIDRTKPLALDEIPSKADAPSFTFASYRDPVTKQPLGAIVLERQSTGAWKFTADTVNAIPAIYATLENAPSKARLGFDEKDLEDPHEAIRSKVPLEWRHGVLGLEVWQWGSIIALLGISLLIVPVVRLFVGRAVRLRVPFIRENVTKESERGLKTSVVVLVLATVWRSTFPLLALPLVLEAGTIFVLRIMGGLALAWLLMALFDAILDVFGHVGEGFGHRTEHILIPVVRKFGKTIILFATALFVASALDLNLAGVVAGLGIGGLVLALAAKDSVENLFGSLTILFDMPFGVGDWVKVGSVDGTVEQINLRSTRIRTGEDSVITLPNSNLIKASVENLGQRRFRRLSATLGLDYGTSPDKIDAFCQALRDLIANHPKTKPGVAQASLHEYTPESMKIRVFTYFDTRNYDEELQLRHELLLEIMRIADRLGIRFAHPAQTLVVQSDELPKPNVPDEQAKSDEMA